jgi:hypothetical protein
MDEPRLVEVLDAVRGARSAFQNLCGDRTSLHAQADSGGLLALDVSFQALGNVVETLERVVSGGAQIQLVDSILATPAIVTDSGGPTSLADAIIADMRNLQARLDDVKRTISLSSVQESRTLVHLLPLGEAMSMRGMIDKYRGIISEACSGQILCVIPIVESHVWAHFIQIYDGCHTALCA